MMLKTIKTRYFHGIKQELFVRKLNKMSIKLEYILVLLNAALK